MKKLYIYYVLLSSVIFWPLYTQAQTPYNKTPEFLKGNSIWAFPEYSGLDFNSGTAVPTISEMPRTSTSEGSASVCDRNTGNLLFYTNGETIWNANHQPMPNGDTLFGNGGGFNSVNGYGRPDYNSASTRQGALIVPFIEDSNKYYVFSLSGLDHLLYLLPGTQTTALLPPKFWLKANGDTIRGTLFYSVVDMTLNNGLGDVIPSQKNILLDSNELAEAMIAIPGECGSIWLLVHTLAPKAWETLDHTTPAPKYKAYEITAAGINPVPVISNGKMHSAFGWMCVSSDKSTIAMNGGGNTMFVLPKATGLEVAKFNIQTGEISNPIVIEDYVSPSVAQQRPDLEDLVSNFCIFSPDGNMLYYNIKSNWRDVTFKHLLQCDISSFDSSIIASTRLSIAGIAHPAPLSTFSGTSARLYNDTIYLAEYSNGNNPPYYLTTINNPNASGTNCDLQVEAIPGIPSAYCAGNTLGSETVFMTSDRITSSHEELICKGWNQGIELSPNNANGIHFSWSDNSNDSVLIVNQEGTYWVNYYTEDCSLFYSDTFHITGAELPEPVIRVDEFKLSTALLYHTYQWLFNSEILSGETDSVLYVEVNGDYQVIVTNKEGCVDTSEAYPVNNADIKDYKGLATQIQVWPNPIKNEVFVRSPIPVKLSLKSINGKVLQQNTNSNSLSMRDLATGLYLLRIMDKNGNLIKVEKLIRARE